MSGTIVDDQGKFHFLHFHLLIKILQPLSEVVGSHSGFFAPSYSVGLDMLETSRICWISYDRQW